MPGEATERGRDQRTDLAEIGQRRNPGAPEAAGQRPHTAPPPADGSSLLATHPPSDETLHEL
jgi:hypothetical protein